MINLAPLAYQLGVGQPTMVYLGILCPVGWMEVQRYKRAQQTACRVVMRQSVCLSVCLDTRAHSCTAGCEGEEQKVGLMCVWGAGAGPAHGPPGEWVCMPRLIHGHC